MALAQQPVTVTSTPGPGLGDEETELVAVLRELESDEALARGDAASRRARHLAVQGAVNFFRPFAGGNGRSCATCHDPRDGFSLSPARVEARWQRLQRARRDDPSAADPLFRPLDADDGADDFTLLRTRALFKVRVALPPRVRLTDDPTATHVTVSRAVTPLNLLKHTAPYQLDRSAATLEAQALAAVYQHMEPTAQPSVAFLESVAEFQRHIFSSAQVRALSAAIDRDAPIPSLDPPLTPLERTGKEKFDDFCGRCHGGPAQVRNLENRIFPPFDGSTNPVRCSTGSTSRSSAASTRPHRTSTTTAPGRWRRSSPITSGSPSSSTWSVAFRSRRSPTTTSRRSWPTCARPCRPPAARRRRPRAPSI
jgi:cytochrome c peroxidase